MAINRGKLIPLSLILLLGGMMLGGALGLHAGQKRSDSLDELRDKVDSLRTVHDELAIRDLLNAYGIHLDGRDFHAWVSLFTQNGRWIGGLGEFAGHQALLDMLESNLGAARPEDGRYTSMHLFANPVIEIDGGTAVASSRYVFFAAGDRGGPQPVLLGRYEDQLVKTEDGWRFRERRVHDDLFAGSD